MCRVTQLAVPYIELIVYALVMFWFLFVICVFVLFVLQVKLWFFTKSRHRDIMSFLGNCLLFANRPAFNRATHCEDSINTLKHIMTKLHNSWHQQWLQGYKHSSQPINPIIYQFSFRFLSNSLSDKCFSMLLVFAPLHDITALHWLHMAEFSSCLVKCSQACSHRFLLSMMLPRGWRSELSQIVKQMYRNKKISGKPENLVQEMRESLRRINNVGGVQFRWNWSGGPGSEPWLLLTCSYMAV